MKIPPRRQKLELDRCTSTIYAFVHKLCRGKRRCHSRRYVFGVGPASKTGSCTSSQVDLLFFQGAGATPNVIGPLVEDDTIATLPLEAIGPFI